MLNTLERHSTKNLIMHGIVLIIMVAYRASILQLKVRVETQNIGTKGNLQIKEKRIWVLQGMYNQKN